MSCAFGLFFSLFVPLFDGALALSAGVSFDFLAPFTFLLAAPSGKGGSGFVSLIMNADR